MSPLLPAPAELVLFAAAVAVLNATPGVDFLLTVTRTLQGGARAGMAAALGIGAGCVVHALAAAFGLAALLALHPAAFVALQWAGAAWLGWLGVGLLRQAWRRPAAQPALDVATAPSAQARPLWLEFRTGALTNLLNPKVALFFLAFLPQFVPAGAPDKTAAFLLLGAWFVLQGTLFLALLVLLAARLSRWQATAAARRALGTLGGVLFVALALRLLGARPALA
ncbi:MAG: LysE family translocator [Rubrivivax sp.]|nr:LysE family translocator [Rubrivivax sp.]